MPTIAADASDRQTDGDKAAGGEDDEDGGVEEIMVVASDGVDVLGAVGVGVFEEEESGDLDGAGEEALHFVEVDEGGDDGGVEGGCSFFGGEPFEGH